MKKITAITLFQTAVGIRASMAYSEIDDNGMIIKDNSRIDRVLVDPVQADYASALMEYAQSCIDKEG